jgi:hypothetical protein
VCQQGANTCHYEHECDNRGGYDGHGADLNGTAQGTRGRKRRFFSLVVVQLYSLALDIASADRTPSLRQPYTAALAGKVDTISCHFTGTASNFRR